MGRETKDTERHSLTLPPLPNVHHPTGSECGRSGGLKGHGDRTGQEASRAAAVLGAMAGQGTRAAMAERGGLGGHGGSGDAGGHGGAGSLGGQGGSGDSGGHGGAGSLGGLHGG